MEVIIDGLQPVQVPVQPAGSPALVDDAVLRTPGRGGPAPEPVTCALVGPEGADGTKKTVIRLPSDVLFAFGSAELTPAARVAIEAVDDDIGSGGTGTVTIEGHTDAIGSDPDNQDLESLSKLLVPAPDTLLQVQAVSTDVNNVRNKGPHLIDPF